MVDYIYVEIYDTLRTLKVTPSPGCEGFWEYESASRCRCRYYRVISFRIPKPKSGWTNHNKKQQRQQCNAVELCCGLTMIW